MHAVSKHEYLISFIDNGLKHIVTGINAVLSRVCECGHIEVNSSPVQLRPSPLYPLAQWQLYDPCVFVQIPFLLQS